MDREYRISNDGTIFEIKEDGSIAKLYLFNIFYPSENFVISNPAKKVSCHFLQIHKS